jgi:hypothetical protein
MKSFLFAIILMFAACASHKSYNQTTRGVVHLRGGVFHKEAWDETLVLKRMSWYHGMTLYYDVMSWKADADSPFSKWFSNSEKEFFTKCEHFLVTAAYAADPTKISHVNFREQMKLNGYDDVVLNTFASSLKSHPHVADWRFPNYKIMGYCKRSPSRLDTSRLAINFPSFKQIEADL